VDKIKFLKWLSIALWLTIATIITTGCANYHFGDISKTICYSTDKEFRAGFIATLSDRGVDFDVNYCASVGLVDALIVREHER